MSVRVQHNPEKRIHEPLNLLHEHGHEWAARNIGPYAVLGAIRQLIPRELKNFEETDIIAGMNHRIIGPPATLRGEQ